MGHLLKIKCVDSRVNVNVLASTSVQFKPTTVQVPNLTLHSHETDNSVHENSAERISWAVLHSCTSCTVYSLYSYANWSSVVAHLQSSVVALATVFCCCSGYIVCCQTHDRHYFSLLQSRERIIHVEYNQLTVPTK
jgi:hypothetical protein